MVSPFAAIISAVVPFFCISLIFSLASKMPALLHAASPAGVSTESTVAPSGIVTVMFVSGIVYVFDDALSAKVGRQKTTASMKTASRQPIKRMLFL